MGMWTLRITAALPSAVGWETLDGVTTVTAVNGVANFSVLILRQASSYEYLYVNASGLPSAYSSTFSVIGTAATHLAIPSFGNVIAGVPFRMTVDALDPYGNVDPTFSGDVTLALADNPAALR